jgi:hypothetical protein
LVWFSRKFFPFILNKKYFSEIEKNLKIPYYLLIISNLVIKFFIFLYFILNLFFSISSLRIWFNLIFISILVLIFMIVICFSLTIFLIEIFYILDLILILLIVFYFIWNNLWNYNNNFLISSILIFLSVRFDLHCFYCYLFYLK